MIFLFSPSGDVRIARFYLVDILLMKDARIGRLYLCFVETPVSDVFTIRLALLLLFSLSFSVFIVAAGSLVPVGEAALYACGTVGSSFFSGFFSCPSVGTGGAPRGCAPGYDRGAFQAPEVAPLRGASDRMGSGALRALAVAPSRRVGSDGPSGR